MEAEAFLFHGLGWVRGGSGSGRGRGRGRRRGAGRLPAAVRLGRSRARGRVQGVGHGVVEGGGSLAVLGCVAVVLDVCDFERGVCGVVVVVVVIVDGEARGLGQGGAQGRLVVVGAVGGAERRGLRGAGRRFVGQHVVGGVHGLRAGRQEGRGALPDAVLLQEVGLQVLTRLEGLGAHAARHPLPPPVHVGHVLLQVAYCAVAAAALLAPRPLLLELLLLPLLQAVLGVLPHVQVGRGGRGWPARRELRPLLQRGRGVNPPELGEQHRQIEVT